MSPEKTTTRAYTLRKRAEAMEETRRRITAAAIELHGTVGPARTTISAVADRAGVQRHTVYRHFPTDAELLAACSNHYGAANPPPDLAAWPEVEDPAERVERALDELYAFYERTGAMWENVFRDEALVEAVGPVLAPFRGYLDEAAGALAQGWGARGKRRDVLRAATRHVVAFETWRSLARDGALTRAQAVALAAAMVRAAGT